MNIAGIADQHLIEMSEIFRLLGDPSRLRILLCCHDGAKPVGRIAQELSLPQPLVSRHLRLLRGSRMVARERDGKQMFYRAADGQVRSILKSIVTNLNERSLA